MNDIPPSSVGARITDAVPLRPRSTGPSSNSLANWVIARSSSYQPQISCLIATLPRSGSWLLSEALFNTGLAGEANEYFRPDFTSLWAKEWGLAENIDYTEYVSWAKRMTSSSNDVFSAKLHWYQFAWLREKAAVASSKSGQSVDDLFIDWFPNLRFVFLSRKDVARQAISYFRAAHSEIWYLKEESRGSVASSQGLSHFDFQQIRWFEGVLDQHGRNWRQLFHSVGTSPLELVYEDFVDNYDETVSDVLSYLGVPSDLHRGLPRPTLLKQADRQTDFALQKYMQIRDSLRGPTPGLYWCSKNREFRLPAVES